MIRPVPIRASAYVPLSFQPRDPSATFYFITFFFPFRLSSPSSPSPPVVSPLSSMLYSLGPSQGAAHSVHVPGMADRPDPFTRRFSSPSSFTPSLTPLPSTPLYICMRRYRLGCLVCTSVPFVCPSHFPSLPVFLSKMMREEGGGGPEPFAFERVFYRMPHTHTRTHSQSLLETHTRRVRATTKDRGRRQASVCYKDTSNTEDRQRDVTVDVCVVTRVTHTRFLKTTAAARHTSRRSKDHSQTGEKS